MYVNGSVGRHKTIAFCRHFKTSGSGNFSVGFILFNRFQFCKKFLLYRKILSFFQTIFEDMRKTLEDSGAFPLVV